MARQLVYTSAPQGLTPGRTGYGTVARHADLRERLVPLLERLSVFPSDWQPTPVICAFRWVDVGGTRVPVLSRLIDAGHDYTHRSHFLAHHLIFDPAELAGAPTPADIFLRWPGWLTNWDGPPRWLDEKDLVDVSSLPAIATPALPAQTWNRLAGDAGRAALLTDGQRAANRVLRCSAEQEIEVINLLREASALLTTAECWRTEFTTCLLATESATSYCWSGVRVGTPADTASIRTGLLLDLTQPATLPPAPTMPAARLARDGPLQAKTPVVAPPRQNVLQIKPAEPRGIAAPTVIYTPAPAATPAPPAKSGLTLPMAIIGGIFAALAAIATFYFLTRGSPNTEAINPVTSVPPVAPMPAFNPTPAPAAPTTTPRQIAAPTPAPAVVNAAISNEQILMDIERLAGDGKFLDSLARWKTFASDAPDFAQAHIDVLKNRLLPGARTEWVADIDHLIAQLVAGPAVRGDLEKQFDALRNFPKNWPVTNPEVLNSAVDTTATIFKVLKQLPDAPVYVVDGFTTTGAGADYQDASVVVTLPEVTAVLASNPGRFHVSAAAATSIIPPPAARWFNFDVQATDFVSGDFLILPDTSRGEAGGRYLQLLSESPGKTRLNWRLYQPQSDFFQRYPANAPLAPSSREMWLHFVGEPPLTSFYLLLRRPDSLELVSWKPLPLPLAWLESTGSPAQVSLPAWLAANLPWHALPGQSFRLSPTLLDPTLDGLADSDNQVAATPAAVQFAAASLVNQLNEKIRTQQTELAQAQQKLTDLQTAAAGPVDRRPEQAVVDQAVENVNSLERAIAKEQSTVQKVSTTDWPSQTAPWMLYDTLASKDSLIFLQFTPHETGSSP